MASMFAKSSGAPAGVMQPSQPPQIERYEPEEEKPKQPKKVSFAQFDPDAQMQMNSVSTLTVSFAMTASSKNMTALEY